MILTVERAVCLGLKVPSVTLTVERAVCRVLKVPSVTVECAVCQVLKFPSVTVECAVCQVLNVPSVTLTVELEVLEGLEGASGQEAGERVIVSDGEGGQRGAYGRVLWHVQVVVEAR